jgi:hypothetical protein
MSLTPAQSETKAALRTELQTLSSLSNRGGQDGVIRDSQYIMPDLHAVCMAIL